MAEQEQKSPRSIYPMGLHRDVKERVLGMMPEAMRDEARGLLRTAEETAVIFAKISRNPGSFTEIAKGVDEEGAGKFHQQWTVSVEGYGHESVAEHAVIQVAFENISSRDGDEVTDNRYGNFTEFSARFKGRQGVGAETPVVVLRDPILNAKWQDATKRLFEANDELTRRGREWVFTSEAVEAVPQLSKGYYSENETDPRHRSRLTKAAADAFKDMLHMGRFTSIGVTMNARVAEGFIRKMLSAPGIETREVGMTFKDAALQVAPTLVRYADFQPYLASLDRRRDSLIDRFGLESKGMEWLRYDDGSWGEGPLVDTPDVEAQVLAGFVFESSRTSSFRVLYDQISNWDADKRKAAFQILHSQEFRFDDWEQGEVVSAGRGRHDKSPRAAELDGNLVVEIEDMTTGMWREYKRHRPQTYIAKPLDTKWGYKRPVLAELLDKSNDPKYHGSMEILVEAVDQMTDLHREVMKVDPAAAELAVTRLHYRPSIAQFSFREAEHLFELRTGNSVHPFLKEILWPIIDAYQSKYSNMAANLRFRGERQEIPFP